MVVDLGVDTGEVAGLALAPIVIRVAVAVEGVPMTAAYFRRFQVVVVAPVHILLVELEVQR